MFKNEYIEDRSILVFVKVRCILQKVSKALKKYCKIPVCSEASRIIKRIVNYIKFYLLTL